MNETQGDEEAKVFLSYSRKDRERAASFSDALRARHFGVFKDTDDILPTEEWRDRLRQLIEEADTIVFLLSPHSATSEVCAWEIEHAHALNKRIAPIVIEDVEGADIPPLLARLNFIFATVRDPFQNAVDSLVSALNTDIDWIREHTRLNGLAGRWDRAGRPAHLLMRGQDIFDAERWRDSRPVEAPAVTPLHAVFISDSRRASARRQRLAVVGSLAALAVALVLAGFAYVQRNAAVGNEELALRNERRAAETRDQAWLTQSAILTDWARAEAEAGDRTTASLLLLAGLPDANAALGRLDAARPVLPDAVAALFDVHLQAQEQAALLASPSGPFDDAFRFSPDGAFILSWASRDENSSVMRLWDAEDGALLRQQEFSDSRVAAFAFHPDGESYLTATPAHEVVRWDLATGEARLRYDRCPISAASSGLVRNIVFSRDGRFVATDGFAVCIHETESGTVAGALDPADRRVIHGNLAFLANPDFLLFSDERAVLIHVVSAGQVLMLYPGTGTVTAKVNETRSRVLITDTGDSPALQRPSERAGLTWPKTVLWDLSDPREIAVLSARDALRGAEFNSDGRRVVASQRARIKVWDAETGAPVIADQEVQSDDPFYAENESFLLRARFASNSPYIISTDYEDVHELWNKRGRVIARLRRPRQSQEFYTQLAMSPRLGGLVSWTRNAPGTLWRLGNVRHLEPLEAHLVALALDPATREKVAAYIARRTDSKLQGLDWPNGEDVFERTVTSSDGLLVATWPQGEAGPVRITDEAGSEVARIQDFSSEVLSVAIQPGAERLATATRDAVQIWSASGAEELARLEAAELSGLGYRHRSVVYSADGRHLVVLGEDFIDVFNTADTQRVGSLISEDAVLNAAPPPEFFGLSESPFLDALKRNQRATLWAPTKDDTRPRFWRHYDSLQVLVDAEKALAPRCLDREQMAHYHLGTIPPLWCITGAGLEAESDPAKWRPKRPYDTPEWRDWLLAYRADPSLEPPTP